MLLSGDMPASPDLWPQLVAVAERDAFLLVATAVFACAIVHAFLAPFFARAAHRLEHAHQEAVRAGRAAVNERGESSDFRAAALHLLGEVEAVFGIWTFVLFGLLIAWPGKGWDFACRYVESGDYAATAAGLPAAGPSKFIEPLFVFVIMTLAAARPVMTLAGRLLGGASRLLGDSTTARWFVILTLAPLFGSVITEPAAMTIGALLLSAQFYALRPSDKLKYATLALLFVNVSVGGAQARHVEHGRRFEDRLVDLAHAGVAVDHRGHEGGDEDHHHLGRITQAQPDDGQRDPGQRRDRAQHQKDRVDQRLGLAAGAHGQTQCNPDRGGHGEAHGHQQHAAQHMFVQTAVAVAVDGDLAQRHADLGGRGKARRRNEAGDRREQMPQAQDDGQRQHGRGQLGRQPAFGGSARGRAHLVNVFSFKGSGPAVKRSGALVSPDFP
jgi:hypothetical protein